MGPSAKHTPTSLMTFNVRGLQLSGTPFKKRIHLLFIYLENADIDELHLQEVYTYQMLKYLRKHLQDRYPHVSYRKGIFGPQAGLVSLFKKSPDRTDFYSLPASQIARLDPLKLIPYIHKGVLVTTLDKDIRLNLHLDPDHTGEWEDASSAMRLIKRQLDSLTCLTQDLSPQHNMVIVLGDFNLPTDTPLYRTFVNSLNLKDALESNTEPTFHASFLPKGKIPRQIDHVLVRPQTHRTTAELVLDNPTNGVYGSDHIGIQVSID
jgi:endonuclease/exonuclease/phosphatase family metal-dependent hydrolase